MIDQITILAGLNTLITSYRPHQPYQICVDHYFYSLAT